MENKNQSQSDHDLLIRISEIVKNISSELSEVKKLVNDNTFDLNSRLKIIEILHDKYNLEKMTTKIESHDEWIKEFKTAYRVAVLMAGITGGVITFLAKWVLEYFNFIK